MFSIRKLMQLGIAAVDKFRCNQQPLDVQYNDMVRAFLFPRRLLLDAGCGPWSRVAALGKCRMVIGVDSDKSIRGNLGTDAVVIGDLSQLPFSSHTFDLVVTSWVIEHLDNPQTCFLEFNRILEDGGHCVILTPNLLHYGAFVPRLTPHWFHKWFARTVLRLSYNLYPTPYKANTPKRLVHLMETAGFEAVEIKLLDHGPIYLNWFAPAYATAMIYHRMLNRFGRLSPLRYAILAAFQKRPTASLERSNPNGKFQSVLE
jgi:SAM-dependent methyltransferase